MGIALTFAAESLPAAVYYVDVAAAGANNGISWANAYTNLQAALTNAPSGSELWVRAGTYGPIALRTNSLVFGGFAGTETDRNARDWNTHVTWIDGGGARAVTFSNNATLDGFATTNTSGAAGAVYFNRLHGVLANCRITGNTGGDAVQLLQTGGSDGGTTIVRDCTFEGNAGTAVFVNGRTNLVPGPHVVLIDRCRFDGNHTDGSGGAVRTDHASHWLTIQNCVFTGNSAASAGGAMYIGYSSLGPGTPVHAVNCTFVSNSCPAGKAICVSFESATLNLQNAIVWGATNDQIRTQNGSPVLLYGHCDLQGGAGSVYIRHGSGTNLGGVIDADPQFSDAAYHLGPSSPCIDAGLAANAPDRDFDGDARPQGNGTDIGADEFLSGPVGLMLVVE